MYSARVASTGAVVAERLRSAHTHWTRFRGLLGTRTLPPGDGLWLRPCSQVHMIGMRYAVDLAFLDDRHRVVRTVDGLQPNRISPRVGGATSVVELAAGTLQRLGLAEGDRVTIDGPAEVVGRDPLDVLGAFICNLAMACLYAFFATAHFARALGSGEWATTMPLVAQEAVLMLLFLTRRRSIAISARPADWVVGITGTFLPLLMRPGDALGPLSWLGRPMQAAGLVTAIVAAGFLGRSIGVVAANRGIKTDGLYRVVRHPMYAGYVLGYLGYVASYPSVRNCLLAAATLVALTARAVAEERFLSTEPRYSGYLRRTRWRFLPYVY